MADESTNTEGGQQETERKAPTPNDVTPKEKTFTQEDVDRIVKERMSRERSKHADYDDLKAKATNADSLQEQLDAANASIEKLKGEARQAEHEKELAAIRSTVAAQHGITDPSVLAGDDEKQIGESAEKLMKVFSDMRSRDVVADASAHNGQAKPKTSTRDDFANAMKRLGL